MATDKDWLLHELDITNAFLHGYIVEKFYTIPPKGYRKAKIGQISKL